VLLYVLLCTKLCMVCELRVGSRSEDMGKMRGMPLVYGGCMVARVMGMGFRCYGIPLLSSNGL
jgi:hypothetical protein